jgi:hypothetical protein
MEKLFGEIFVQHLFSEGPFLFALYCSFIPIILYVLISSIITYHQHKDQGVLELFRFGSFKTSSYIISLFIKDVISVSIFFIYLFSFFFAVSRFNNLLLGPLFIQSMISLLFVTLLLCAYGKLAMVATSSPVESLFLLIATLTLFLLIQLGTYSIVSENLRTISSILSSVVQWFSPFYYVTLMQTGFTLPSLAYTSGGILGTLLLSVGITALSLHIVNKKERRS